MKTPLIALLVFLAALPIRSAEPLQTILDDGWQGAQGYHFSGRLTEIRPAPASAGSRLGNLYRNSRMLFTSGEEGLVTWRVGTSEWTLRSDDHGYWELAGNPPLTLPPGWHAIESAPAASSPAGLLVADPRNLIGIISDIDDTILVSDVLKKAALLSNSLTVAPEQRDAVPGMAQLYTKILLKNPAAATSPVFYVSSSPRQLTDNLRRFLTAGGFPRGVLQLKEISPGGESDSLGDHEAYKLRRIESILAAFPKTRFHLFGDDGERDPEIYAKIQGKFPQQVIGVWIRRVNPDPERPSFLGQGNIEECVP